MTKRPSTPDRRNIVTPYQRLAEQFQEFRCKVVFPRTISMWSYPKARLSEGWNLTDLYERTAAAAQLGYDVVLVAKDDGLVVKYVAKRPD